MSTTMRQHRRYLYLKPDDWTWWAWTVTAVLLAVGLAGHPVAYLAAMGVTVAQAAVLLLQGHKPFDFALQLRVAYLLLLVVSYPPAMRWLYWLPAAGTLALVVFGYCLLARMLSLLPWNNRDPYTLERLRRTFFSPPDLRRAESVAGGGACAGGLCTIEAQVAPPSQSVEQHPS